jgi:hypothetical protein
MGNKNNNLEDFLRGKFSDLENLEEEWAKPSSRVRSDVLDQITKPNEKKRKRAFLFFFLLFGIGISSLLFAYFKSGKDVKEINFDREKISRETEILDTEPTKKQSDFLTQPTRNTTAKSREASTGFSKEELIERNTLLRTVIQNQNDVITQLKKEILRPQKNTAEQKLEKDLEGKKSKELVKTLLETNDQLKREQGKLKVLNKVQQKEIEQLNYEKQLLLDSFNTQVYALNLREKGEEIPTIKSRIAFEDIKPLAGTELEEKKVVVEPIILQDNFSLDKPKRKVEFEIGYQLGLRGRMTEVIEYIEGQGTINTQLKDKFLVSHEHGLNIGVSPIKNFWIKTGAHIGSTNLHQKHAIKFNYDANRIGATTSIGYTDYMNDLSLAGINILQRNIDELSNAQGAVSGDELDVNFQTNLVLTSVQIPLEFNYLYGKKKLQGLFQLGGQWNLLNYKHYIDGVDLVSSQNTSQYATSSSSIFDAPEKSSVQYWGLHAGVGLSYNISKSLVFQGMFSYEYYFQHKIPSEDLLVYQLALGISDKVAKPISNMRFGLKLGLNYRF